MTKYIIKNCPAHDPSIVEWNCLGSDACECKDGHCVLKQIVEKCKFRSKICKDCGSDVCFECEHLTGGKLANEILSMLELEECGE